MNITDPFQFSLSALFTLKSPDICVQSQYVRLANGRCRKPLEFKLCGGICMRASEQMTERTEFIRFSSL